MRKSGIITIFLALFLTQYAIRTTQYACANNVSVTNGSPGAQSETNDTIEIQFDLSWDNSWRKIAGDEPYNYDAAWVFVKYSTDSGATWNHAYLSTTAGDHTIPLNYEYKVGITNISPNDRGMGVFIQRQDPVSASWSGTASLSGVKLMWRYGQNGVTDAQAKDPIATLIRVMAVEMVYIPLGAFSAGSGGSEASCFTKTMINTANATTAPSGSPLSGGYPSGQTAPANASWPNGYSAFYAMKYELSQEQYVDFFNTLTSAQKTTRDITSIGKGSDLEVSRNTVSWTSGDATAGANANVACNFINWADISAYADWAGLRPFTELEFEKACRGIATAVANEYAWGTATIAASVYTLSNEGTAAEGIDTNYQTTLGNCIYNAAYSNPVRCGIFAAHANNSGRITAGASYYGVMELSGNLWERSVTIGHAVGRSFTGLHGDGSLNASGDANVTNWPAGTDYGTGFRGGSWLRDYSNAYVSDRTFADWLDPNRSNEAGGRLARTSP